MLLFLLLLLLPLLFSDVIHSARLPLHPLTLVPADPTLYSRIETADNSDDFALYGQILHNFCIRNATFWFYPHPDDKNIEDFNNLYFPYNRDESKIQALSSRIVPATPWGKSDFVNETAIFVQDFSSNIYHWHLETLWPVWQLLTSRGGTELYRNSPFIHIFSETGQNKERKGANLARKMDEEQYFERVLGLHYSTLFLETIEKELCFRMGYLGFPLEQGFENGGYSMHLASYIQNLDGTIRHHRLANQHQRTILMIQRKNNRILNNFEEMTAWLQKNLEKDEIVVVEDLEEMSLMSQAKLFHMADMVIAMHGAALGWVRLMNAGSIVVEILPWGIGAQQHLYPSYCQLSNCMVHQIHLPASSCQFDKKRFLDIVVNRLNLISNQETRLDSIQLTNLTNHHPDLLTYFPFVFDFLMFSNCSVPMNMFEHTMQIIKQ